LDIQPGWQLKGALDEINVTDFNNPNIISVWTYDSVNQKWKAYLPNSSINLASYDIENLQYIKKGEGFWVNSAGYTNLDLGNIADVGEASGTTNGILIIDKPLDLNLSDVANKTFKILDNENKGAFKDLAFDENGVAEFTSFGNVYDTKYENGVLNIYENDNKIGKIQKIKSDENGMILFGVFFGENGEYPFFQGWLKNITPVDMGTLSYPKTFYNTQGNYFTIDNNKIAYSFGEEENYTIENGKIVTQNSWGDENNGGSFKKEWQIIGQIDRYYVVESHRISNISYENSLLEGKTVDDLIDANQSILGYHFDQNGKVVNEKTGDTGRYTKVNSNELNLTMCDSYGACWNEAIIKLDSENGKVTVTDEWYEEDILSESPIVDK